MFEFYFKNSKKPILIPFSAHQGGISKNSEMVHMCYFLIKSLNIKLHVYLLYYYYFEMTHL